MATARMTRLIAARDLLEPDDPVSAVTTQIEEVRNSSAPGKRVDRAVRRSAELRLKLTTAQEQLQKQQEHLRTVSTDLEEAEKERTH